MTKPTRNELKWLLTVAKATGRVDDLVELIEGVVESIESLEERLDRMDDELWPLADRGG